MTASTRRAALGAILAAPLASVPAVAALSHLPGQESRFIAIGPQLVQLLDEYDRLWAPVRSYYEAWERAAERFPIPRWQLAEKLPEWGAYLAAREPADAVNDRLVSLYEPFEDEPMTTLPAILLRLRYALTFDAFAEDAMDELREHWRRHPLCA
ncbi:hypothetical protein [Methylobacterium sp. J-070]|uniref:hypothetical protein n=1 Tax=Methylobacterium sp. J-070 TaxID=2836650 RepID=UPI001FBA7565|nr:hypothetical protein [Methylobacterium sp. J-070]MCJ2048540.1 hypothetical protein [Methylobacterium sp. J-070]